MIELAEDPLEILRRDPLSLVADDHLELALVLLQLNRHLSPGLGELDRVRDQVVEHEPELAFVGANPDRRNVELQLDRAVRYHEPVV